MMQTSPHVRSAQDGVNDALWARANQLGVEVLSKADACVNVSAKCHALHAIAEALLCEQNALAMFPRLPASEQQLARFAGVLDQQAGAIRRAFDTHKLVMTSFPFSWLPLRPRVAFGEQMIHRAYNAAKEALNREMPALIDADHILRDVLKSLDGPALVPLVDDAENLVNSL
jgi:hypothetical protein